MSPHSKIIAAIVVAAVLIAGAILWTGKHQDTSQMASTAATLSPVENTFSATPPEEAAPTPSPALKEATLTLPPTKSFEETIPTGNWVLNRATLNNKTLDLSGNVPSPLTLQINTKTKQVYGFAGCNSFSGSYTTGGGTKFTFVNLTLGKKACPPTSPEKSLMQAMGDITTYGMKGSQLVFDNNNNSTEIVYDPAK